MKRILVLLAVLLPVVWFAAGCNKGSTSSSPDNLPSKEEQKAMEKAQMELMKQDAQQGAKKKW